LRKLGVVVAFLRSTVPVTTELGTGTLLGLLTGKPALGFRAISGHAATEPATKRPVKAAFAF